MKQQRRKRHYISLIAFFILALLFSSFSTGISAQEPAVKIWPFPEDLPEQYKSSDFSIPRKAWKCRSMLPASMPGAIRCRMRVLKALGR